MSHIPTKYYDDSPPLVHEYKLLWGPVTGPAQFIWCWDLKLVCFANCILACRYYKLYD